MILATTIQEWVDKIGNYELGNDSPAEQREANFEINRFLNPQGQLKLYENTHPTNVPEPTVARERFLRFLGRKFQTITWQADRNNETVHLEDFLQDDVEDGLALYKAAIEEESKSKAFREAVFFRSLKHFPGNKWINRLVLWVGGPSSSGKTYAAKGVIEKMSRDVLQKTDEPGGNNVVSVDGSYERETSQMRQMALQFALASGYKGIYDLHTHSKQLVVKKYVRDAALEDQNLSLVIPDTFVRNPAAVRKDFNAFADKGVVQAFAEVKGEKKFAERFQTSVKKMGDSRAWNKKRFTEEKIKMNNREIGCESKVYQGAYFKLGLHGTKIFKKFFKSFSSNKSTLTVTNDLMYLVKKEGVWKECEYGENLDNKEEGVDFIRITARAYNYWRDNKIAEPLETWYQTTGKFKKTLTEQIITHKDNEKYSNHYSLFNLFRTNPVQRFFSSNAEQEKRKLRHQIAVNDETIADLENAIEEWEEEDESLTKKLKTCKLLQVTLKEKMVELESKEQETNSSSTQFLPYLDNYIDIPASDIGELLSQASLEAGAEETAVTSITSKDEYRGEFLAPKLEADFCRVHYVELTSDTSSKAMFTQEKLEDGFRLSSVQQCIKYDPDFLFEYSLAMAGSMLIGLNETPSPKNQLFLYGADPELLRYLWTALVVLGEKMPSRQFNPDSLKPAASSFRVSDEMESKRKFSPQSLHETVFKEQDAFINLKVRELENLLKLKSDPVEQAKLLNKELVEASHQIARNS
ncbi:hypothetical protein [Legionella hackeliae]|uniref:Uncharacterized protein n=1 Tax=Legionella hackeliae TaxID=449 RepID=A0A0A8UXK1_LEGHA|nr:hypothetical protein [Legionella hackeliae]KTD15163.1 interaptin [Legionella hackeliae]CEK11474.1 protein of unknown function [coiled-coil domain] [Legionella hackeliae]STX48244.1 interaptin [Legionella hackeliae]